MKKIVFVLISALVVFVGTFLVTDRYVTDKMVSATDSICNYVADELANDFDGDTHLTEEAVTSFLSGNFVCVTDSATGERHFMILNEKVEGFPHWVQQNLEDFLAVNPYFRNAIFFVDESVCRRYSKYGYKSQDLAEGEVINGSDKQDQGFSYDFMHAKSYNAVKSSMKSQWRLPSPTSPMKGTIISYYVPITSEDGSFFGVFVLNLDISLIRDKIVLHLPYGKENSEMIIADPKGAVIASFPQEYEGFLTIDSLRNTHNVEYTVYKRTLSSTKWVIYTFCNPESVYKEATYIRLMMIFISVIGLVLVLICFFIIYRQVYSNLRARAQAEEEIRVAAKVQMSMLKQRHYECGNGITLDNILVPAKSAGGDLYDYIWLDDKLIFCIGDVSGKGLSAALFMTQVVSLFRNAVNKTHEPAEIVSQINDVLVENNPDLTFCTFFCGVLDTSAGLSPHTLTFCNAGHNPPVLLPDDRYLKVKPNIAIGLMGGFSFVQETLDMKDNTLLMYTDGVTEAKNKNHQCFGDDSLIAALENETHPVEKVMSSVSSFVNGFEQSDDITIVCLKVGGEI